MREGGKGGGGGEVEKGNGMDRSGGKGEDRGGKGTGRERGAFLPLILPMTGTAAVGSCPKNSRLSVVCGGLHRCYRGLSGPRTSPPSDSTSRGTCSRPHSTT